MTIATYGTHGLANQGSQSESNQTVPAPATPLCPIPSPTNAHFRSTTNTDNTGSPGNVEATASAFRSDGATSQGIRLVAGGTGQFVGDTFHTTSVDNLAELIRLAAERPASRVLNCGDPEPPSVLEIGRAVGEAMGHVFEEVLVPQPAYERRELSNPWAVPVPLVVDMSAAERDIGYRPVTTYGEAVRATCAWLAEEAPRRDWTETYLGKYFDYAAEDVLLQRRAGEGSAGRSPRSQRDS